MDRYKLYYRQEKEFQEFMQERALSYDQLRRSMVKSLWKLCQNGDFVFTERVTLLMAEVQQWEAEWGYDGKRKNALMHRHAREWKELADYHKFLDEVEALLPLLQN